MSSNPGSQSSSRLPGELDLIRRIRARAGRSGGALRLGIGDDCALLRPRPDEDLAVTTDLTLEGRHFRLEWHPPESVGHRTLARGLSDLAAMGARPVAAFLSLALPRGLVQKKQARSPRPWPVGRSPRPWMDRYLDGFLALAASTGTPLAGGDLAEAPAFAADIVLIGAVGRGRALLRSGARPGHLLYVTGALGGAAAGLSALAEWAEGRAASNSSSARIPRRMATLLDPHLSPQPRLAQGQWLACRALATAALDISDGLSTDLEHLCEESCVAAEVDAEALPVRRGANLEQALHGGEDYELLFTARPADRIPAQIGGVPVTRIGRVLRRTPGRPLMSLLTAGKAQPLHSCGWEHFA